MEGSCVSQFSGFPDSVSASLSPLTSSNRTPVFEDVETIIVYRGMGCAESKLPDTQQAIVVEEYLNLPRYAVNATIFLNGWHLRYLNGKHNVAGLGTSIYNIRLENGPIGQILRWRAGGALSDDNFDEPYRWCYTYTIVAWNPANLALVVDHDDGPCSAKPEDTRDANYFADALNKGTTTALSAFPSFIQNPAFVGSKTVAILPVGLDTCGSIRVIPWITRSFKSPTIWTMATSSWRKGKPIKRVWAIRLAATT